MMGLGGAVPVYAYGQPVDMRKGGEALSGLVRSDLGQDPLAGAFYLFTNRRRTHAKVLHCDGTGLCLYSKRLFRGHFAALWRDPGDIIVTLTTNELRLFLEGSELVGRIPLSKPPLRSEALVIGGALGQA